MKLRLGYFCPVPWCKGQLLPSQALASPTLPQSTVLILTQTPPRLVPAGTQARLEYHHRSVTFNKLIADGELGLCDAGIILWPGTKRAVTLSQAKPIVNAVRAGGAEPVAVFVDEDARGITASCGALGITLAQLHGARARQWFPHLRSVEVGSAKSPCHARP